MGFDTQCWECRLLQIEGSSFQPLCSQCETNSWTAAEHSDVQLLQRPHRYSHALEHHFPTTQLNIQFNRMGLRAQIHNETLTYFNLFMAPDFAPTSTEDFRLTDVLLQEWGDICKILLTCVVANHKTFRGLGNNDVLMLEHQALATRELNNLIQRTDQGPSYAQILEAMTMFMNLDIQQSSYGPWRIHLDGAKALLNSCPDALSVCSEEDLGFLAILDIYGTTTTPSELLSAETVTHHSFYRDMFDLSGVDSLQTPLPVPDDILYTVVAINIYRAEQKLDRHQLKERQSSLDAIFSSLEQFDPQKWAAGLSPVYQHHSQNLARLATCFASATLLYLLQSCHIHSTNKLVQWKSGVRRQAAYRDLKNAITALFRERLRNVGYYKTIFWPMVICGIESATQGGRVDTLCDHLETLTVELGTNGMREAAAFLKGLVELRQSRGAPHGEMFEFEWDEIFARAPIFIL